ncbi:hypothetical protein [Roseicella aquatilis]|uniref:Uncharacterized protein n=1 Tax=Roseicella aquatilis TaxID=2527868 RepID=A0A4R4D3Q7_9PROT|nr:hypothetical protein [Roseicella aquatilis]TCZ51430.1 hypothetical protein EXY23_26960 [Roseicella aquatilis]
MSGSESASPLANTLSIENLWEVSAEELRAVNRALPGLRAWLALKLKTGRCSWGFAIDLAVADVRGVFNSSSVLDQIERIESQRKVVGDTKEPTPFKHEPLKDLWHAHFYDARFAIRNLVNENSLERVTEIMALHFGKYADEVAGEIAHGMVIGSYERRAARNALTGEWIVYEPRKSGNYYLTIAFHNEAATREETDRRIFERVSIYRDIDEKLLQQVGEQGR